MKHTDEWWDITKSKVVPVHAMEAHSGADVGVAPVMLNIGWFRTQIRCIHLNIKLLRFKTFFRKTLGQNVF